MAAPLYLVICSKCQNDVGVSRTEVSPSHVCNACLESGGPARPVPIPKLRPFSKARKQPKQRAITKPALKAARTERQRMSGACAIYAIQMRPGVVKVGRTTNWAVRKHSYTNGFDDVIKRSVIFWIIDDFEILPDIETALLQSIRHPRAKGYEWLLADFDEVAAHADEFLRTNGIMFERE